MDVVGAHYLQKKKYVFDQRNIKLVFIILQCFANIQYHKCLKLLIIFWSYNKDWVPPL